MWTYRAKVDRVVDGDTVDVVADLGFGVFHKVRLRLARIDAPERHTTEGRKVKALLEAHLPHGQSAVVVTSKGDRHGRWIAELQVKDTNISDWLLAQNLVNVYEGS